MKSSRSLVVAALVAAIALPGAAFAAKADKKKDKAAATETFASVDKNGDGSITQEEFLATQKDKLGEEAAKTRFATLDKNKDGKLTSDEFGSGTEEKKKRRKKNQD